MSSGPTSTGEGMLLQIYTQREIVKFEKKRISQNILIFGVL